MSTHRTDPFTVEDVQHVYVTTFVHVGRYKNDRVRDGVRNQCLRAMVAKVGVKRTAEFVASCCGAAVAPVTA